jgi:hypothetical protein
MDAGRVLMFARVTRRAVTVLRAIVQFRPQDGGVNSGVLKLHSAWLLPFGVCLSGPFLQGR